jgi:hypothetical protein
MHRVQLRTDFCIKHQSRWFKLTDGTRQKVLDTPSMQRLYGTFATLFKLANTPLASRPCMGFAPGAKGSPRLRPSGVEPVFFPYTRLLVIVRTLRVGMELR